MKTKSPIPARLLIVVFLLSTIMLGCHTFHEPAGIKRNQDFNNHWLFINEDIEGAEKPDFDDSGWRKVDLPHDWSIEDYPQQDSLHIGPFYKKMKEGQDVGYLRGGEGWYRKTLRLPDKYKDKQVYLHFDGVQSQSTLFVNGKKVGEHVYGYTPFYFDITGFLDKNGAENVIAMKVVNPEQNSRWFAGAGIYREVAISYVNPIHVNTWGVGITTPKVDEHEAEVRLEIDVYNGLNTQSDILLVTEITSSTGKVVEIPKKSAILEAGSQSKIVMNASIENPDLWSIETPDLYTAKVSVLKDNHIEDIYTTSFGIRSIDYSAEEGFLLNGKPVLLKGACMHHDNGILGAAAFKVAEERRVQVMKDNGYIAIRTSHNPPSQAFLYACDKLGVLVIDESFDHWLKPKRPNDYHQYYAEWWKKDTEAMLLRDRNHPSVIMWSIGNEIQERADSSGLDIAREAITFIKSIDPTRPVTAALCGFWDNPGKTWDDSAPAFALLDIGGYNYKYEKYESDHEKYPERIMYGSESVAQYALEYWERVKKHSYVVGDFVWTGMDYIGEAGIGHSRYYKTKDAKDSFWMDWPWYISWCGDIDILGNKKPQSYYRDIIWEESKLEMAVHEPVPEGMVENISFWGWPKEYQSWNWEGHEGRSLEVSVYTSYPEVKLELNGELIGERTLARDANYKHTFKVPYTPGTLKVTGMIYGEMEETREFVTTGPVASLVLVPERKEIKAERSEIAYIHVLAVDKNGILVPNASTPVQVEVTGEAELLAAGNASPLAQGSFKDKHFSVFEGRGMIIIRSTGKTGEVKIMTETEGIGESETRLVAR